MKATILIKRKKDGTFNGDEGQPIPYFWYKGETDAGLTIEFGSKNDSHEEGETVTVELEKSEGKRGFRYKEIL